MSTEKEDEENFGSRMVDILNHGALNVAIGMGSKLGLFEALANSAGAPMSVNELAKAAGDLSPRVVREWLGIVSSGGIVQIHHENDHETFSLPPHRAKYLCRQGGADNLAVYCQEIPLLTHCVYPDVLQSFREGKGIPYSKYPNFQDFMNELANNKYRETLLQTFLPSIEGMAERLREGNMRVMDLGSGQGLLLSLLAREFPKSTFVGIDLDADAIAMAQEANKDLENLSFVYLDATCIHQHEEYAESFDYVLAFDVIHDLCEPDKVLKGIRDALKPGGLFSMVDIKADSCLHGNKDHPMGPLLYTVSLMHCMQVAMLNEGAALGMLWGRQKAVAMLEEAGFHNIKELDIPKDGFNLHYMAEK